MSFSVMKRFCTSFTKMHFSVWRRLMRLNSAHCCLLCDKSLSAGQGVVRRFISSSSVVHKASSLFVSNAAAQDTGSLEVDLNLAQKMAHVERLRENLAVRRIRLDLDSLVNDYKQMTVIQSEKEKLEAEKDQISQIMAQLKKTEENDDVVRSRDILKARGRELRDDLRNITKQWWDLENKVMLTALTLPNDFDEDIPTEKSQILDTAGQVTVSRDVRSHIEICKQFDMVKFSSVGPRAYYLKNDLTVTLQSLISSVTEYLTEHGFSFIAAPGMFRSLVAEGCGVDFQNSQELYKLYDRDTVADTESKSHQLLDMLHLCGVSLLSFAGYLTKVNIDSQILPLRMFSVGTHYQPKSDLPGLLGALQSTKAVLFSASKNETSSSEEFNNLKNLIWNMYKSIGLPVRLVHTRGSDLNCAESKRVEVQMYAPNIKQFVQVAFASQYRDFVSRRLCTLHSEKTSGHKQAEHVHMVHGQAMDMTTVIACAIEYGTLQQGSWRLPEITIPNGPCD